MTRDEYLSELDRAMAPVTELLSLGRMGVEKPFNPLLVQMSLETAKVLALAAIAASGTSVPGGVLEVALDGSGVQMPVVKQPPASVNGSGLVLPS